MVTLDEFANRLIEANVITRNDHRFLYDIAVTHQNVGEDSECNIRTETLEALVSLFVDAHRDAQLRRWIGVVLSRLLHAFQKLCHLFSSISDHLKRALGTMITSSHIDELKHIAGNIIFTARTVSKTALPLKTIYSGEILTFIQEAFAVENETQFVEEFNNAIVDYGEKGGIVENNETWMDWAYGVITADGHLLSQCGCILLELVEQSLTLAAFPLAREIMFLDVPLANIQTVRYERAHITSSNEPTSQVVLMLDNDLKWTYVMNTEEITATKLSILFSNEESAKEFAGTVRETSRLVSGNSSGRVQQVQSVESNIPAKDNIAQTKMPETSKQQFMASSIVALLPSPEEKRSGNATTVEYRSPTKLREGLKDDSGNATTQNSGVVAPATDRKKKATNTVHKSGSKDLAPVINSSGKLINRSSKKPESQRSRKVESQEPTSQPQTEKGAKAAADVFDIPADDDDIIQTALSEKHSQKAKKEREGAKAVKSAPRRSQMIEESDEEDVDGEQLSTSNGVDPKRRTRASLAKEQQSGASADSQKRPIYAEQESDEEDFEAVSTSPKKPLPKKTKVKNAPKIAKAGDAKKSRPSSRQGRDNNHTPENVKKSRSNQDSATEDTQHQPIPQGMPEELTKKPTIVQFGRHGPVNQGTTPRQSQAFSILSKGSNTQSILDDAGSQNVDVQEHQDPAQPHPFSVQSQQAAEDLEETQDDLLGASPVPIEEGDLEGRAEPRQEETSIVSHVKTGEVTETGSEQFFDFNEESMSRSADTAETAGMSTMPAKVPPPVYPWALKAPDTLEQDLLPNSVNPVPQLLHIPHFVNPDPVVPQPLSNGEAGTREYRSDKPDSGQLESSHSVTLTTEHFQPNNTDGFESEEMPRQPQHGDEPVQAFSTINLITPMQTLAFTKQSTILLSPMPLKPEEFERGTQTDKSKEFEQGTQTDKSDDCEQGIQTDIHIHPFKALQIQGQSRHSPAISEVTAAIAKENHKRPTLEVSETPTPKRVKQTHVESTQERVSGALEQEVTSFSPSEAENSTRSQLSARVDSQGSPYTPETHLPLDEASLHNLNRAPQLSMRRKLFPKKQMSASEYVSNDDPTEPQIVASNRTTPAKVVTVHGPTYSEIILEQPKLKATKVTTAFVSQTLAKNNPQQIAHRIDIPERRGIRVVETVQAIQKPDEVVVAINQVPPDPSPPGTRFEKLLNSRAPPQALSAPGDTTNVKLGEWDDADETLINGIISARRLQTPVAEATIAISDDSSDSDSEQGTEASEAEPEVEESQDRAYDEAMAWEEMMRPHQKTYVQAVLRITQRLLTHVLDQETATASIIADYQTNGKKLIDDMRRFHQEEFDKSALAFTSGKTEASNRFGKIAHALDGDRRQMTEAWNKVRKGENERKQKRVEGQAGVKNLIAQYAKV